MNITAHTNRLPGIVTLCSFILLCGALALAGRETLKQHQESVTEHLRLNTLGVLEQVAAMFAESHQQGPGDFTYFPDECLNYFATLEQNNDLRFAGLIDTRQGVLLARHGEELPIEVPVDILHQLRSSGEWSGHTEYDGPFELFTAARAITSPMPANMPIPNDAYSMNGGSPYESLALVVGLDMAAHNKIDREFRFRVRAILAGILLSGVLCWFIMLHALKRLHHSKKRSALEEFQTALLDSLPDGLLTLSADNIIQSANPAALNILGLSAAALIGRHFSELPEDLHPCLPSAENDVDAWLQCSLHDAELEIRTLHIPPHSNQDSLTTDRLMVIRDRTKLRRLEKDLFASEQLAAVGTLAAGLAHELRNPLSSLRGLAQYFQKKLADNPKDALRAHAMVQEADRLNRVVSDMLYLAKPQELQQTEVRLKPIVQNIEQLLSFDLNENGITFISDLATPSVFAQEDGLTRALLNLVLNAMDALKSVEERPRKLCIHSSAENNAVRICVSDTGPGMDSTTQKQAFEPFFSTKAGGTGLGLQLVRKVMRDHKGWVELGEPVHHAMKNGPHSGIAVSLIFPSAPRAADEVTGMAGTGRSANPQSAEEG